MFESDKLNSPTVLATTAAAACLISLPSLYYFFSKPKTAKNSRSKPNNELPAPLISPVDEDFDWKTASPFPYRPYKKGVYKMNLAIKKLDPNDIVCIENTYLDRTQLRAKLFEKEKLFGCHESAIPALKEAYTFIFTHLLKRYPMYFKLSDDGTEILNEINGCRIDFKVDQLEPTQMLKTLASNIEEDVLILLKNPDTDQLDEYILRAGVSLFPAGFNPLEKLNQPLTKIHGPVPGYVSKLQLSMNKFFSRLKVNEFILRNNWSIQTHTNLCAPTGSHATDEEAVTIHPLYPEDLDFNKVFFRVEKQCFTRLPKSKADIMFIRTYVTPLMELRSSLTDEEREILSQAIDGIVGKFATYKRRIQWGEAAKCFLRKEHEGSNPTPTKYHFVH